MESQKVAKKIQYFVEHVPNYNHKDTRDHNKQEVVASNLEWLIRNRHEEREAIAAVTLTHSNREADIVMEPVDNLAAMVELPNENLLIEVASDNQDAVERVVDIVAAVDVCPEISTTPERAAQKKEEPIASTKRKREEKNEEKPKDAKKQPQKRRRVVKKKPPPPGQPENTTAPQAQIEDVMKEAVEPEKEKLLAKTSEVHEPEDRSTTNLSRRRERVQFLVDMGYSEFQASRALDLTNNDVEAAVFTLVENPNFEFDPPGTEKPVIRPQRKRLPPRNQNAIQKRRIQAKTEDQDSQALVAIPMYCFCGGPEYDHMILCNFCEVWYHGECVGLSAKELDKIADYSCPTCEKLGKGKTTWISGNITKSQ